MSDKNAATSKRRKNLLTAALGMVAVVLVWRAIWDMTAAIMNPLTSLIIGVLLLGIIGYTNKEYLKKLL
jgi:hypothetical protein